MYARYICSRTALFFTCCIQGKYDGMSRVNTHGPFSAEASLSSEISAACLAAKALADSGRPYGRNRRSGQVEGKSRVKTDLVLVYMLSVRARVSDKERCRTGVGKSLRI